MSRSHWCARVSFGVVVAFILAGTSAIVSAQSPLRLSLPVCTE